MEKLDKKSTWKFFFNALLSTLFISLFFLPLLIMTFIIEPKPLLPSLLLKGGYLILFFILYSIFCYVWARLTYHYWGYELSKEGFRSENGVIWKRYTTIPYERIQNVDIYRGVIDRALGLSDLQIQTAGMCAPVAGMSGGMRVAEGRLPGLSKEKAEQVRDELIRRVNQSKRQSKTQGL